MFFFSRALKEMRAAVWDVKVLWALKDLQVQRALGAFKVEHCKVTITSLVGPLPQGVDCI